MRKEEMKDDDEKIVCKSREELAVLGNPGQLEPMRKHFFDELDNLTQISLGKHNSCCKLYVDKLSLKKTE